MKKNLKKIEAIGLSAAMILSLVACGTTKDTGDLTEGNSEQSITTSEVASEVNTETEEESEVDSENGTETEEESEVTSEIDTETEEESEDTVAGDVRSTSFKDTIRVVTEALKKSELGQSYMEENPNGVTGGGNRIAYEDEYIHDSIYGTIENRDNGLVSIGEIRVSGGVANVEKPYISIRMYEMEIDSPDYNQVHNDQNLTIYSVSNFDELYNEVDGDMDKMNWDNAVITPEEVTVDFYNGQYVMNIRMFNYKSEELDWKTSGLDFQPAIDAFMAVE